MKIGINITDYKNNEAGGLGTYLQTLLHYLPEISSSNDSIVVIGYKEKIQELKKAYNLKKTQYIIIKSSLKLESLSQKLKDLIIKNKINVWFSPFLLLDPIDCPVPSAVLIPDLQHEHYPDFFHKEVIKWRRYKYQQSAIAADLVFTLSNNSKKDIVKNLNIDNEKVIITPLSSSPWISNKFNYKKNQEILRKYNLRSLQYIYYPANTWPHKNHINLIKAFYLILKKHPDLQLVLSGHITKHYKNIKETILSLNIENKVKFLDYVANEEMSYIYKNALCLAFPSLFEGFGIPLIEAMKVGTPVLASNVTSIPEVAKNAAIYFNPNSEINIARKIEELIKNTDLRKLLIINGKKRGAAFSYKKTIKKTYFELKKIANRKKLAKWPKISVITSSFNQGRFIERTIKSVLNQNYPNLEYLIIDGGSTDNTIDILKKYDSKITFWSSEKDNGQTHGINKGLKHVTGDIISYLNSDDTFEKNTLFKVGKIFEENNKIKFIYGKGKHINENDKLIEDYHNGPMDFSTVQSSCDICQPAAFWKKEVFKKIGYFNEKTDLAMDYEYWIRVSKYFKLVYLEIYFANSRLYPQTKTVSLKEKIILEVIDIQKKYYKTAHDDWILSLALEKLHVKKFENLSPFNYPMFIFKSFVYILKINGKLPSKQSLKTFLYLGKQFVISPFRKIQNLLYLNNEIKKHIEIGIIRQYSPKFLYKEIFPKKKMKNYLKISIVTPSYNQGDYIEDTINSVLKQKYPNFEYIVQDGGSKDRTLKILKKYKKNIRFESKKDKGFANAINLGFKKTNGEIMAYLNSDDMLMDGSLYFINSYFQKHPKINVVFGHRLIVNENNKQIGRWIMYRHDPRVLKFIDYIPQETMFWRRSIWDKVGSKIDESFKFAADWDLIIKFMNNGAKFKRLPYFLGIFRHHKNQKTTKQMKTIGRKEINKILYKLHKTSIPEKDIIELLKKYRKKAAVVSYLFDKGIRI